jgi:hypothetical protein
MIQPSLFPEYESESSSGIIKIFSDFCFHGCSCQTSKDHITEDGFFLEEIDRDT